MKPRQIIDHVYQVGGAAISDVRDGAIYLFDLGELVLIDSGAGIGFDQTLSNIQLVGFDPVNISTVILTHCHMDHIGGAAQFRQHFGSRIIMHALDAEIVERGDQHMTAAWCFGIFLRSFPIDIKLHGEQGQLSFGDYKVIGSTYRGIRPDRSRFTLMWGTKGSSSGRTSVPRSWKISNVIPLPGGIQWTKFFPFMPTSSAMATPVSSGQKTVSKTILSAQS